MHIVTGGAGFIGSIVVSALNEAGIEDILIVDNLGATEKWKNLRGLRFNDYLHKDDFIEYIASDAFSESVEAVIHMGACSSTTETDAEYMMSNNYAYTKTLARWAVEHDFRFIYASSAATYGGGEHGFSDDDSVTPKLMPLNVYGYSKQAFDTWALNSGAVNQMVGLKFFNVFGPNEYHKNDMSSVVFKAFHQIKETGSLKLFRSYRPEFANGEQKRDFVYVKDCAKLILTLLEKKSINGIFNVGTGRAQTWNELGNAVFAAMERAPSIEYIEMPETLREKYQYFTQASTIKLKQALPDFNFHSLEDAVKDYVKNHLETL